MDKILKERGSRYGEFRYNASTSWRIKAALHSGFTYNKLYTYMTESLDMIASKLSRIVNGDPFYQDSWVDIAGYSQLVVNQLKKEEAEKRDLEGLFNSAPQEPSDGYPVYGQQDWKHLLSQQPANEGAVIFDPGCID